MIGDEIHRTLADQPAATSDGRGPEPCRDCRAPLVPGQRYCLYCGTRRPEARLEFLDILTQDAAAGRGAPPAPPLLAAGPSGRDHEDGVNGWLRRHGALLGLIGIVLATLLIGLLLGHWATGSSDDAAVAPAPQVIRVTVPAASGAAPAAAAGAGATAGGSGSAATGASSGAGASTKAKAKAKHDAAASTPKKATTKTPANAVDTQSLSAADKQKAIEKAAKKGQPLSTGGGSDSKLPAKDDKAPANGSSFETFG